jgi:putative transposase
MPRQARLDAPGTLHHVIIRGIERKKIVNDDHDRQAFVFRMGSLASETKTLIYAWALMSNHAHILLRSGPSGLSLYMSRFLTGYAISYNLRHDRHGHLFQNRYKSIVCEEDTYFKELVRYIHLNPLRGKLVESFENLDSYKNCGHSVIIGRIKRDWQDRDYVLKWFGSNESEAIKAYRQFIEKGVNQGRRRDLVGGGLIRSQGGWSVVKENSRLGLREKSDERILGSGEFVKQLIQESDKIRKAQFVGQERKKNAMSYIQKLCEQEKISVAALQSGSRRKKISMVRRQLAQKMVEEWGFSLIETGRHLGVSPPAISKSLFRLNLSKLN